MKNNNMKRATTILLGTFLSASLLFTSCMDVESDRQAFEPNLDSKTDSIFYAFGIAQAMQQLADQYFFQGEMRGELVKTTQYTDSMLSQLKNFSATVTNKYDSAYVYYRVINNCNYYLTHRNRDLRTGATDVTKNEYAAVLAYRAWAYLQLARNYGTVPFFTEPLTSISQIDDNQFPSYNLNQIADALCPELLSYSGIPVPNYRSIGNKNTQKIFIPVDVILGDLYLETGKYKDAADSYFKYLSTTQTPLPDVHTILKMRSADMSYPTDIIGVWSDTYPSIFSSGSLDIVSYIPMAIYSRQGTVTNVPISFGYNQQSNKYIENVQLDKSQEYDNLVANLDYYYYRTVTSATFNWASSKYGDMRSLSILYEEKRTSDNEETIKWIDKFRSGNIILYRATTVYLHLCEALNRMGLPDAAFAFLKEGIHSDLIKATTTWLSDDAKNYFLNTFLNDANNDTYKANSQPIHGRGLGTTSDYGDDGQFHPNFAPYKFNSEIARKFTEIDAMDNKETLYPGLSARIAAGTTTKADTIMAMEELLCDEEAMEFCFEGSRWYDLMRFARHKNRAGLQGNAWLTEKVKSNNPVKSLLTESNWYLPMKK